jgi:hypothetical protein
MFRYSPSTCDKLSLSFLCVLREASFRAVSLWLNSFLDCRHSLSSLFRSSVGEFSPFLPQLANHLRGKWWRKAAYGGVAIAANSISAVQKWTTLPNFANFPLSIAKMVQNRQFCLC